MVGEADHMEKLHCEQEKVLKNEIRELERNKRREGANLEYLKNIVLKYILTDEHEVLYTSHYLLFSSHRLIPLFGHGNYYYYYHYHNHRRWSQSLIRYCNSHPKSNRRSKRR